MSNSYYTSLVHFPHCLNDDLFYGSSCPHVFTHVFGGYRFTEVWPEGSYSMLRGPENRCPSGFEHGEIMLHTAGENVIEVRRTFVNTLYVCTKTYGHVPGTAPQWFAGSYCVFGVTEACPLGTVYVYHSFCINQKKYTLIRNMQLM